MKLRTHSLDGTGKQMLFYLAVPVGLLCVGRLLFEKLPNTRITGALSPAAVTAEEVENPVACYREQPGPKRAAIRGVLKSADRIGDLTQHILRDIRRIGLLEPLLASEVVDERRIDLDELIPSLVICAVAYPNQ